jgi:hypothetical protein
MTKALAVLAIVASTACTKSTTISSGGRTSSNQMVSTRPAGKSGAAATVPAALTPAINTLKVSEDATRRSAEPDYLNSQKFGAPRGRDFQDIIPIGARLTAINVCGDDRIAGIWLTYEAGGKTMHTPCRGLRQGREHSFTLDKREKVVGIHGYGTGSVELLVIATNLRVGTLGNKAAAPPGAKPACTLLDENDVRRYVGVGIVGRADDRLRQVMMRLQIRS